MAPQHKPGAPPSGPAIVVPVGVTKGLERDTTRRFLFRVPPRWRSPILKNPFAAEAEARALEWLERLGCTRAEIDRAQSFDTAGYVGIPFPTLPLDKTVRMAKYLSLWLLWDDVHVETLHDGWRIHASHILTGRRPDAMTRFDEGWWQLIEELASERSPRWIYDLCEAMTTWSAAAFEEAMAMLAYREHGMIPTFQQHLEMRIDTIGMFATACLLDDAYGVELPRSFHAHPAILRLNWLAGKIVGLGNDILSFAKDCAEEQLNLVSTLMHEQGLSVDEALEQLIRMHDDALEEYDRVADLLGEWPPEIAAVAARWLQDLRYASLGFSLWESQAPRYTAYKLVAHGRLIEPGFSFFPPRRSEPPGSYRAAMSLEDLAHGVGYSPLLT